MFFKNKNSQINYAINKTKQNKISVLSNENIKIEKSINICGTVPKIKLRKTTIQ